jgi:hypothetical protein
VDLDQACGHPLHEFVRITGGPELLNEFSRTSIADCVDGAVQGFGARLIDGLNAVPLARDVGGRRRGNIEADMLLLTADPAGHRTQLLVEAKTSSNNAWYAAIESLRQLKLFQLSQAAHDIFSRRGSHEGTNLPVEAVVLAPGAFYSSRGAKKRATYGARQLPAPGASWSHW